MGLDTTHDCWSGAYSAFHRWREMLAEVAGLPPLELMDGFYVHLNEQGGLPTLYHGIGTRSCENLQRLDSRLPIRWDALKPDPLHILLSHSDCDGEINWKDAEAIADRLDVLSKKMPAGDGGGHIGNWRDKTEQFAKGLRIAAKAKENVEFH